MYLAAKLDPFQTWKACSWSQRLLWFFFLYSLPCQKLVTSLSNLVLPIFGYKDTPTPSLCALLPGSHLSPFSQHKFHRTWRQRLSCPSASPVSRGLVVQSPSTRHMHLEWLSLQACCALANITMTYLNTGLYQQKYVCFLSDMRLSVDLNPSCVFRQHLEQMPGTLCLYWTSSACPPCSQCCTSFPLSFPSDCSVQYKASSSHPSSVLLSGCPATCCFSNTLVSVHFNCWRIIF